MGYHFFFHSVVLSNEVSYIFFIVSLFLFLFEIFTPGVGFSALLGCIFYTFFLLQGSSLILLSYLFTIVGLSLVLLEVFFSTKGLLFITGFLSILAGFSASFRFYFQQIQIFFFILMGGILLFLTSFFYLGLRKVFSLKKKSSSLFDYRGKLGIVVTDFSNQNGICRIEGELWQCSSHEDLKKGQKIKIIKMQQNQNSPFFMVENIKD